MFLWVKKKQVMVAGYALMELKGTQEGLAEVGDPVLRLLFSFFFLPALRFFIFAYVDLGFILHTKKLFLCISL